MNGDIISVEESRDFTRLDTIIAKGLQTFVEVGEALAEIRDRKLYRNGHATFDDYLKTKWKLSRSRACRLIQATETVKALPTGNIPTTERQARPLTKLPPGQRAEAWSAAVDASTTGTPTAKEVQAAVMRKAPAMSAGHAGEAPGVSTAPLDGMTWLQTATFAYRQLSAEDRQLFRNFQAGIGGGT